jgi:hypothetical protein
VQKIFNLSNAGPMLSRDGLTKALSDVGSGPPVAGSLSIGSSQSWRIEAGGTSAAAVEEGAMLRSALEDARNLYAALEISSGENIRALQQQVRPEQLGAVQ